MIENTIKSQDKIEIYTSEIYVIVDDFIQRETEADPNCISNHGTFPRLIQYVYINYVKSLLNNGKIKNQNNYDNIELLDHLFYIYVDLVYKYKAVNKRPAITEFCIFSGIGRNTIYDWYQGNDRYINNIYKDVVTKWYLICEQALIDDPKDVVKSIFMLKSKYGYREEPTQVIVTNNQQILTASDLPQLGNTSHFDIEPKQMPQNSEKLIENS